MATATKGAPSGVTQFLAGAGYVVLPDEPRNWRLVRSLTIAAAFPVAALLAGYYAHLLSGEPERISATWGGFTIAGIVLAIACVFVGSITALKWALDWRSAAKGWQHAFERTAAAYRHALEGSEPSPWNGHAHKVALAALDYVRQVERAGAAIDRGEEVAYDAMRSALELYSGDALLPEDEYEDPYEEDPADGPGLH
jgi:hypothetical protein